MGMIISIPVSDYSLWYDCDFVDVDFLHSIKRSGIISPVIVRRVLNGYQVCIGVKRARAARMVGFETIPAVVQDLTDKEVIALRIEDNISRILQKSMSIVELSKLVATYYDALKTEISVTVKAERIAEIVGSVGICKCKSNIGRTAEVFRMSEREVSRYIRISMLVGLLKPLVDSKRVSERAAVELSYLPAGTQSSVAMVLLENMDLKLSTAKAELLRAKQEFWSLSMDEVKQLLCEDDCLMQFPPMKKLMKKYKLMNKTPQELEVLVDEALGKYFQ